MPNYQRTEIIGHVGRDPEMRYLASGTALCSFSVAVSDKWTDKATGELKERTNWYACTVWGKSAENAYKLIAKGSAVFITGTVEARAYIGKDGEPHASLDLRVDTWQLFGGKGERQEEKEVEGEDIPF